MAFHDNFWVVAGAAAPVIALANLVALPDSYKFIGEIRASKSGEGSLSTKQARMLTFYTVGIVMISAANLCTQAYTLQDTLVSLANESNALSFQFVINVEGWGLGACLLVAFISARTQMLVGEWEKSVKNDQASPEGSSGVAKTSGSGPVSTAPTTRPRRSSRN